MCEEYGKENAETWIYVVVLPELLLTTGRLTGGRLENDPVTVVVESKPSLRSVGVTLGSLDRSACRLDMEGMRLGTVGLAPPWGLVWPVFKDFGGDGHSGRWWKE